jgi:hypothetical protein
LFDLGLGPVALSFVGASGKDDLRAIADLRARFGGTDWTAEWLWQRNLKVAAARWLGGEVEQELALDTLNRHRETWPAEWLRRHGRDDLANKWMQVYDQRVHREAEAQAALLAATPAPTPASKLRAVQ